ncbi:MAG: hypothetical protein AB7C90_01755 [Bacteroidales bacterium]
MLNKTCQPQKPQSITDNLPRNYVLTAWETLNRKFSKSYIQKVATGARNNLEIMEVLIDIARKYRISLEQISKSIADLSNNNPDLS